MPRASKEKVEATVFRKMYEDQHIKKEPEDPELTLKPDLARTLAPYRQQERKWYHSGKWDRN